jgi:hypothetical protein
MAKSAKEETTDNGSAELGDAAVTLRKRRQMAEYKAEHKAREEQQRHGKVNPLTPEGAP